MMDKWAFWRRRHRHDGTDSERIRYADLEGAPAGGSGLTAVSTDATLDGDGTSGDPLTVVSAPKLSTARTIKLTGDVTGSASFDGSAGASIAATVGNDSHTHGASTLTGVFNSAPTDVKKDYTISSGSTYSYQPAKDCILSGYVNKNSGVCHLVIRLGASTGRIFQVVRCEGTSSSAGAEAGMGNFSFPVRAGVTVYFKAVNSAADWFNLWYQPFG